ncbi:unnamed protein product, partial [Prorocentrum cordatum]
PSPTQGPLPHLQTSREQLRAFLRVVDTAIQEQEEAEKGGIDATTTPAEQWPPWLSLGSSRPKSNRKGPRAQAVFTRLHSGTTMAGRTRKAGTPRSGQAGSKYWRVNGANGEADGDGFHDLQPRGSWRATSLLSLGGPGVCGAQKPLSADAGSRGLRPRHP